MNFSFTIWLMIQHYKPHIAKYFQLSQHLQKQIVGGELSPDQQLPTEDVLVEKFGVSRGTVRKAVDLLATQGLVRREQGRGTFVNNLSSKRMAGFVLSDFARDMQRQQRQASTIVLTQTTMPAADDVAARLELSEGEMVIHIQRLRLADQQPIIFEERFLNANLCPQLEHEDVARQSIHWLLVHKYKLPLVRVTHTVEMQEIGRESAELLKLKPFDQVFAVERLTYTKQDGVVQPAVFYRALCHGEEYQFKAQFNMMI